MRLDSAYDYNQIVDEWQMNRNYDNLANGCARHLKSIGICIDLHNTDFDLKAFSIGVCNWMGSQGFRHEDG